MTIRIFSALALGLALAMAVCRLANAANSDHSTSQPPTVTVGVFGLFHPRELAVAPIDGHALVIHAERQRIVLERSSGISSARVTLIGDELAVIAGKQVIRARSAFVTGRQDQAANLELAVPGKIRRRYRGRLEIAVRGSALTSIVTMDREDAVASVVAAESSSDTPLEALKAQAVAARSYFAAARGRHRDFDFCDTTHCQFLREIPAAESGAGKAAQATLGLVLSYEAQPISAMYTRSCSGRTHTAAEVKLPPGVYPYYPVECAYCRAHPARWQSKLLARDAAELEPSDEPSRLKLVRRLGWSTVPSNDFVSSKDGEFVRLDGVGQGHGIGLCQAGARAMAEAGADFRQILAHYYPNTVLQNIENRSRDVR